MTAPQEVFSFVSKFLHLCSNGENANLSLKCEHGSVFVNLQLHLCPDYHPSQGGMKYFTSWEPILSVKNFARNSGSQTRQKTSKIAVIWVFLPVTRNFFLWQDISASEKNFILWQKVSSCDKIFLSLTRNFQLWHEIPSHDKKFLTVTRDFF